MELFKCSKCKLDLPRSKFHEFKTESKSRPVTSRCRVSRKEAWYISRHQTVCICCTRNRPLNLNRQCSKCNAEAGLRQCNYCQQIYQCTYASMADLENAKPALRGKFRQMFLNRFSFRLKQRPLRTGIKTVP